MAIAFDKKTELECNLASILYCLNYECERSDLERLQRTYDGVELYDSSESWLERVSPYCDALPQVATIEDVAERFERFDALRQLVNEEIESELSQWDYDTLGQPPNNPSAIIDQNTRANIDSLRAESRQLSDLLKDLLLAAKSFGHQKPFTQSKKVNKGGRRQIYSDSELKKHDERWMRFKEVYQDPENVPLKGTRRGSRAHFIEWNDQQDGPKWTEEESRKMSKAHRQRKK